MNSNAACAAPIVPALNAVVPPEDLVVEQYGPEVQDICMTTCVSDLWEDYAKGERIDHPGAMTINDSDHSIATRLYQNPAKVHFDGTLMAKSAAGKRLVYGGHLISICKALAYDGLENALSILAINGGSHVSPTYAGDTVSCATTVLDKFELGHPHVAALRLRLVGAKNVDSSAEIKFGDSNGDKASQTRGTILDLDYTIAIPKRTT